MKWMYSIRQKSTAALLLGLVMAAVLLNNFVERDTIEKLNSSFSAMYEDRLLAESYIYQFAELLHEKRHIMDNFSSLEDSEILPEALNAQNDELDYFMELYDETKLTLEEEIVYNKFKATLADLKSIERKFFLASKNLDEYNTNKILLTKKIKSSHGLLSDLSAIQIDEGKRMNEASRNIVHGTIISSRFELAVILVIALLIQALIFTSKSLHNQLDQRHRMN
jgi:hypothetical protein